MADTQDPTQPAKIDLRTGATKGQGTKGATKTGAAGSAGGAAGAATATGDSLFSKFEIPETVRAKHPDLIPLVLETESMNDDERQYWFQILPIMSDDQVNKLREILHNEKQQLSDLDKEYQQEIKRINTKHVAEWKEYESKEKRKKLKEAESNTEKAEAQTEEELLNKLQGL